jgi:hypothetical protein
MISLFRSFFQKPSIPDAKCKPSVELAHSDDAPDLTVTRAKLDKLLHDLTAVADSLHTHLLAHSNLVTQEPELHSFLHRIYMITSDTGEAMRITRERAGIRAAATK